MTTETTIKDTTANPAPLGLLAFGMTTVLLNLHNVGPFPNSAMILGWGSSSAAWRRSSRACWSRKGQHVRHNRLLRIWDVLALARRHLGAARDGLAVET